MLLDFLKRLIGGGGGNRTLGYVCYISHLVLTSAIFVSFRIIFMGLSKTYAVCD